MSAAVAAFRRTSRIPDLRIVLAAAIPATLIERAISVRAADARAIRRKIATPPSCLSGWMRRTPFAPRARRFRSRCRNLKNSDGADCGDVADRSGTQSGAWRKRCTGRQPFPIRFTTRQRNSMSIRNHCSGSIPTYPEAALDAQVAGFVTLVVSIDEVGKVVRTIGNGCGAPRTYSKTSAEQALASAAFYPAQKDGRTVRSRILIKVEFDPAVAARMHNDHEQGLARSRADRGSTCGRLGACARRSGPPRRRTPRRNRRALHP